MTIAMRRIPGDSWSVRGAIVVGALVAVILIGAGQRSVDIGIAALAAGACAGRAAMFVRWRSLLPAPRWRRAFATMLSAVGAAVVLSTIAMPPMDRVAVVSAGIGFAAALVLSGAFDGLRIG